MSDLNVIYLSQTATMDASVMDALAAINCQIHPITYHANQIASVVETVLNSNADAIVLDKTSLGTEAYKLSSQLHSENQIDMPIIIVGNLDEAAECVEALRSGASLCLDSNTSPEEMQLQLIRAIECYSRLRTLRAEYETETNQLQTRLATKNEFIQTLSHDLKNPLSIIYGSASLIKQQGEVTNEIANDALNNILSAVQDMRKLLSNLLNLEKMESNGELDYQPIAFIGFLSSCVESFQAVAENANIKLTFQALSDDKEVELDHDRMIHALSNLVANAIKYTPAGGEVTVSAIVENPTAKVAITDTGIGIPQDALPHIFNRFYRAATTRHISGTGLGLAIARAIVEKHDGTIEVESTVGEGTTFHVSLPLVQQK